MSNLSFCMQLLEVVNKELTQVANGDESNAQELALIGCEISKIEMRMEKVHELQTNKAK